MKTTSTFLIIALCLTAGCSTKTLTERKQAPPSRAIDLQSLIDNAENGETITIPFGEYKLPKGLIVKNQKGLIITTEFGTRILVDDTDADVLTVQDSENIQIHNLYLRHVKPLEEYVCHGVVIRLNNSTHTTIENCVLNGCGAIGVHARSSSEILVKNCHIYENSFNAFYFDGCDEVQIQSNIIEDNGNFIQMYRTESLEMRDNIIRRNGGYWKSFPDPRPGLY